MNNQRRKVIAQALTLLEQARDLLEPVRDEEQEAYDNMPEGLQASERGEIAQQWTEALDTAFQGASEACDALESVE